MAIPANDPDGELRSICSTLKDEVDNAKFELGVWKIEIGRLANEINREIDLLEDLNRQANRSGDNESATFEIRDKQNEISKLSREIESAENELRKWQDQVAIIERQRDANRCHLFF